MTFSEFTVRALRSLWMLALILVSSVNPCHALAELDTSKLNSVLRAAVHQKQFEPSTTQTRPFSRAAISPSGYVVFIRGPVLRSTLEALNITVRTDLGLIKTAIVPESALAELTQLAGVHRVEGAVRLQPQHEVSVPVTGATALRGAGPSFAGINGEGVVIGIVDTGIEYRHDDFDDPLGFTRIEWIWDQTDNIGPSPAGYGYGSEWSAADIDLSLPRQQDTDGHGTHVAGSAAGDGSGTGLGVPAFTYTGMAPRADIVAVKTTFSSAEILDGVQYVFQQAGSRPAVCNLSLGGHLGPHDGTSALEEGLDLLSGKGRIIIASAGNDRGRDIHAEIIAPFASTETARMTLTAGGNGIIGINGFYDATADISVSLITPNGTTLGPITQGNNLIQNIAGQGLIFVENSISQTSSGDHEIYLELSSLGGNPVAAGDWDIVLERNSVPAAGETDFWIFRDNIPGANARFTLGQENEELCTEPANADSVCAVAAWTTKESWIAVDSNVYSFPDATPTGSLTSFSSPGPTRDGRLKPDLSAPGSAIISTKSSPATVPVAFRAPDNKHAVQEGTSMAAAHVSGAVALIQQARGALYPSQAKTILSASALVDVNTGSVPNIDWGYGKLYLEQPVPAALTRISVEASPDAVTIEWSISSSVDLRSFQVTKRVQGSTEFYPLQAPIQTLEEGGQRIYVVVDRRVLSGLTYEYLLISENSLGDRVRLGPFLATIPARPTLAWAFAAPSPNPVRRGLVQFAFTAATAARASLEIFDARGRSVAKPLDQRVAAGTHTIEWDTAGSATGDLPPGIYLLVFRGGETVIRDKIVLLD